MTPNRNDLVEILKWTDQEFGDWLRASLTEYSVKDKGRFSFTPLHTFFGQDYDVTEELFTIFVILDEHEKNWFRSALAVALAGTTFESTNFMVIKVILDVARRTNARGVLSVLANNFSKTWRINGEMENELYGSIAWTIGILARFAGESSLTNESVRCIEQFARSNNIPAEYVIPLFRLICEIRNNDLAANLSLFCAPLSNVMGYSENTREESKRAKERQRLINFLLEICGDQAVLSTLKSGSYFLAYRYTWWQIAVFAAIYGQGEKPLEPISGSHESEDQINPQWAGSELGRIWSKNFPEAEMVRM